MAVPIPRPGQVVSVVRQGFQAIEWTIMLVPRIVGNNLKLHAALLMALLVIASQVGGLLFVILVAPLTAIARDVFLYVHQRLKEPPIPATMAIARVLDTPGTSGE